MSRIIDFAAPIGQKAGPGRSNDLDMLEVGMERCPLINTVSPARYHITLFNSIRGHTFLDVRPVEESPLILRNHITNIVHISNP